LWLAFLGTTYPVYNYGCVRKQTICCLSVACFNSPCYGWLIPLPILSFGTSIFNAALKQSFTRTMTFWNQLV